MSFLDIHIGKRCSIRSWTHSDHVPYRNSKLTRLLQPSLQGNARISVICTINPSPSAIAESTSTLGFAQRIKRVALKAERREVVDTDALIERYRKEIEDLKMRLKEREEVGATGGAGAEGGKGSVRGRRLSAREVSIRNLILVFFMLIHCMGGVAN